MTIDSQVETSTLPAFDFDDVTENVLHVPPLQVPQFDAPELTKLTVPLSQATVGVLVTSGAYYPEQEPLGATNDLSFRLLPRDRGLETMLIAHRTPVRAFGAADPNVAYPLLSLLDLEKEGLFARLADNAYSMVGSISLYEELAQEVAPRIVADAREQGIDLLLVLPFCPQCHVAAGVLARAIERRGLPTTSLTTLRHQANSLKPPRATFLDFPVGCPGGRPGFPDQQRDIIREALLAGSSNPEQWKLTRLPFSWNEDGSREWEALVGDLYRIDNQIRGTVTANLSKHSDGLTGNEQEFAFRCAC